jgi:hypothetical protein
MFKEHFISALVAVNRNCPLQLWDDFLSQVELILNLLRFSQQDPIKSAKKEVNGKFDYNKTPLAPLGTKGLVYKYDSATHASSALLGNNAYCFGPALKNYRCLRFYIPNTRQYQVADTWCLYPTHCTVPTLSPTEGTILKVMDTLTALGSTVPTSTSASVAQTQAIQKLHNLLLPVLYQGKSNLIATDTPSPRMLCPRLPAMPEPRVPTLGPSPRLTHASACSIAPATPT